MNTSRLVALLASLYPAQADSDRIMEAAGIDAARINQETNPNNRWRAIVREADKLGCINALMQVVAEEYPDYADLAASPLRILLLAGRGVLSWVDEEADKWEATPNLAVFALRSNVTMLRVLNQVLDSQWDLLVILGHGDQDGIELGNGERIPRAQLAQLMRGRISRLFINTCESEAVAELIRDETQADVIATIGPVDDKAAFLTGAILASHLGQGATFRAAYELSKPGNNKSYRYLPSLTPDGARFRSQRGHDAASAG